MLTHKLFFNIMAVRLFLSGVKIRLKIRIIEFLILTPNKKESRSEVKNYILEKGKINY